VFIGISIADVNKILQCFVRHQSFFAIVVFVDALQRQIQEIFFFGGTVDMSLKDLPFLSRLEVLWSVAKIFWTFYWYFVQFNSNVLVNIGS